jgi:hypothetical protein
VFKFIQISVLCLITALASFSSLAETDPTKPLWGSKVLQVSKAKSRLVLQSIISNGEVKKVIINGKILKVGDRVSAYKVTAIKAKSVKLSSADKNIELTLFSNAVVKKN